MVGVLGYYLASEVSKYTKRSHNCSDVSSHQSHSKENQRKKQNKVEDAEQLESLMREQLVRNYQYFGEDQDKVRKSFVIVIGCGGIGR